MVGRVFSLKRININCFYKLTIIACLKKQLLRYLSKISTVTTKMERFEINLNGILHMLHTTITNHFHTITLLNKTDVHFLMNVQLCQNMRSELDYSGSGLHSNVVTTYEYVGAQGIILSRNNMTVYQINDQNTLERVHLILIFKI